MNTWPLGPWEKLLREAPGTTRSSSEEGDLDHAGQLRLTSDRLVFEASDGTVGFALSLDTLEPVSVAVHKVLGVELGAPVLVIDGASRQRTVHVDQVREWAASIDTAQIDAQPLTLETVLAAVGDQPLAEEPLAALDTALRRFRGFPEGTWDPDDAGEIATCLREWLQAAECDPAWVTGDDTTRWAQTASDALEDEADWEETFTAQLEGIVAFLQGKIVAKGDGRLLYRLPDDRDPTWVLLDADEAAKVTGAGITLG